MAKIDVIMPQMGESIAEGTLSRWIKKVGDTVKRDEPIFEISTDKVDAEIPAPAAGVLAEILVKEGETVAVQTVVARIETDAAAAAASRRHRAPPAPAATAAPAPSPPRHRHRRSRPRRRRPAVARSRAGRRARASRAPRHRSPPWRDRHRGQRGRIGRGAAPPALHAAGPQDGRRAQPRPERDPRQRARRPGHQERHARATSREAPASSPAAGPRRSPAAPSAPAPRARAPLRRRPASSPGRAIPVQPWSRIRKLTAEHMVMSRRVSPHVNTIFEIDYTRVSQVRAKRKKEYADRGVNLTYLAFIAKAMADALRRHPVRERRGLAAKARSSGATSISASRWRSTGA